MIKYLKNDNSVIKVDTEIETLTFCIIKENLHIIRCDSGDTLLYNNITVTRYNEGKYVDATEEEFLSYRTQCLNIL
jgi:hypothetical protein